MTFTILFVIFIIPRPFTHIFVNLMHLNLLSGPFHCAPASDKEGTDIKVQLGFDPILKFSLSLSLSLSLTHVHTHTHIYKTLTLTLPPFLKSQKFMQGQGFCKLCKIVK